MRQRCAYTKATFVYFNSTKFRIMTRLINDIFLHIMTYKNVFMLKLNEFCIFYTKDQFYNVWIAIMCQTN